MAEEKIILGTNDKVIQRLEMPDGSSYVFNAYQLDGLTREELEAKISGSVDYLGLVSSLASLSTTAGYGDFYRVGTGFTDTTSGKSVHSGDLLVANKANPAKNLLEENWVIIHGEEGNLINHKHDVTISAKTLYNAEHNHTFTGTAAEHSHSFTGTAATLTYTPSGTVGISTGTGTPNYTPGGTVASTIDNTLTGQAKEAGQSVSKSDHTHEVTSTCKYTPAGTINATFTGSAITLTGSAVLNETDNVDVPNMDHTHGVTITTTANTNGNYTPAGSVSQPTFSAGYAAANSTDVVTVASQDHTHTVTGTVSQPSFTGTKATISGNTGEVEVMSESTTYDDKTQTLKFAKESHKHSYSNDYTPTGSVSQPTFSSGSASKTTITGESVSKGIHSHTVTGTVSQPSFTGTKVLISATTAKTSASSKVGVSTDTHTHDVSVSGTTTGSITGLSFTGSEATITVKGTTLASSSSAVVSLATHTHELVSNAVTSTFTGTGVQLKGSFSGSQGSISYTPEGTIGATSITPAGSIAKASITVSFPETTVTSSDPK